MKNRIAIRLMLYFTGLLLVFAVICSTIFYQFFKEHLIEIKKQELSRQATKIAEVISDNMERLETRYGEGISQSRFINYIDNLSNEMVWVVDKEHNISINTERMHKHQHEKRKMPKHHDKELPPPPTNGKEAYERLPQEVKHHVEQAFAGQNFLRQEYNPIFDEIMLTVGEPIYDKQGQVKAVLLLHSPVAGLDEAIWAGLRILLLSALAALLLGIALSVVLSWRFTKPLKLMRNNAELLAERDYDVRNNIMQSDEIGDLAKTLDVLAERLKLADEESQKLEKLRREFIANISHELRTPVTVIRGSLEALRDGVVTEPDDVAEFHEQMYNESIFLQRLINDLLDLSRLQNTDFPIEKTDLNFCDVVLDAARGSRRLGLDKEITIKTELDRDFYAINGDYGRLRQMLMIFLHNSLKFSEQGSSIELMLQGNKLLVQDHGCGMAAEEAAHCFERFYKARNEQNKSGSGLGLAIAKQIALRHDMDLELQSEVGQGTTIIITLPPALEVDADA